MRDESQPETEVPPHLVNLEQERAVLGVLLGSPERLEIARDILPTGSAFVDERHQRIYGHLLRLADAGSGFDVVTLRAALKASGEIGACGGDEYVSGLRDGLPRTSLLDEYVRRVHDLWRQRQAYLTLVELKAKFEAPGGFEDSDPVDVAVGRLTGLDAGTGGLSFLDGPAMSARALQLIQAGAEGMTRGLSTGFSSLDVALGGGLLGGKLYVVGGRPGTGKSALVENISLNIAARQTVCVFSQEMDSDENIERFVGILAGVNMNRVRQGAIAQPEYARIVDAAESLFASHLRLNDATGITAHSVRAAVRREQARAPLGAVVIDYLQMMSGGLQRRKTDRRDQELGDITKGLKRMAKDLKIPVLLVASLNRGSENRTGDKRPHLSDLRDSGEIESDADVVMFTYRDELVNEKTEDRNVTELIIRKGRGCALGTIKLRFDPEFTRFREFHA
jgi:replicative DNA helicase